MLSVLLATFAICALGMMLLVVIRPISGKEKILATLAALALVSVVGVVVHHGIWPG